MKTLLISIEAKSEEDMLELIRGIPNQIVGNIRNLENTEYAIENHNIKIHFGDSGSYGVMPISEFSQYEIVEYLNDRLGIDWQELCDDD